MADTRPVTPQDFWPLFETWAKTRITPGILALPHGWAEWAVSDFLAHSQAPTNGPAPDISRNLHLFPGRDRAALLLNRSHPDTQAYALVLHAQPLSQAGRDFTLGVEQEFHQLSHGRLDPAAGAAIPVVLALCHTADCPPDLRRAGFQRHFAVPIGPETVTALSRRGRLATGEGLTRWPEAIAAPAEAFLAPPPPQTPPPSVPSPDPQTPPPVAPASPFSQLFRPSGDDASAAF